MKKMFFILLFFILGCSVNAQNIEFSTGYQAMPYIGSSFAYGNLELGIGYGYTKSLTFHGTIREDIDNLYGVSLFCRFLTEVILIDSQRNNKNYIILGSRYTYEMFFAELGFSTEWAHDAEFDVKFKPIITTGIVIEIYY